MRSGKHTFWNRRRRVMKKRILALVLAVILTVSLLSVTAGAAGKTSLFTDVTTADWFYGAVDYVNSNGLMTGTGKGFGPNDATTRAQIWAILARLDGNNYDRNTGDWYASYQLWAIRNNISDGSAPNGKITREQLAAMLYRYAIRMGFVWTGAWADLSVFPDCGKVSSYAAEAMQWAVGSGLIQGMGGKLNPQGTATRAQVATILWRMCEKWALLQEKEIVNLLPAINPGSLHTHSFSYMSRDDATHTASCKCGHSTIEPCTYSVTEGQNGNTYTCTKCGYTYTAASNVTTPVATVNGQAYASLADAIAAAEAAGGGTVVLTKDTSINNQQEVKKSITIKLNGKKLTISSGNRIHVIDDATLTIDGTVSGSTVQGRFNIGKAENKNGNVVLNGGSYCVETGTVLHINGTCTNSNVTIKNATITSPTDNGIQLNGGGTFLIENSQITGATAVYIKSGELTIKNSTLTGTKSSVDYTYNGNGANATGDAMVVDCCGNKGGAPIVEMTNCTLSGTKGKIGSYEYTGNAHSKHAEITVDGRREIAEGVTLVVAENTYEISGVKGLKWFADQVSTDNRFADKTVKLMTDIDLTGQSFNGIGRNTYGTYPGYAFNGTFDGGNHTISNMSVSSTGNEGTAGFFPQLGFNAVVKNLKFDKATVKSEHEAGVISGYCVTASGVGIPTDSRMTAKIINCHVTNSTVTSEAHSTGSSIFDDGDKAGGIIGLAHCDITDCSVKNTTITAVRDLGGIVGAMNGAVTNCTVEGNTISFDSSKINNETNIGAIIGRQLGSATLDGAAYTAKNTLS